MLKVLLFSSIFFSMNSFSQTTVKPDPNSQINAEEQVHGLSKNTSGKSYSVRTKKRAIKMPAIVAPAVDLSPASCADSLGGKGSASFTACEAGRRTR